MAAITETGEMTTNPVVTIPFQDHRKDAKKALQTLNDRKLI